MGVVDGDINISLSLPGECSIFSAEAFALKTAVEGIHTEEHAIILTDSASCIEALRHGKSKHPWVQQAEHLAETRKVTFCWIPGHAGIAGNEKADQLANRGRKTNPKAIPIPFQDVKHAIGVEIWNAWARQWHGSLSQLRQIKSNPGKYNDRNCASEQRLLTRLRIGHTRLTHSYLLERSPPPICTQCGVRITTNHILLDCRAFSNERITCGIRGTLETILANFNENEKNVIKFLTLTKLKEQI